MVGTLYIILSGTFLLSSIVYLAINKRHQDLVKKRLNIRRRRTSGSTTPPQSISQEKKDLAKASEFPYKDTFPPNQRSTLAQISGSAALSEKSLDDLKTEPAGWTSRCLSLTSSAFEANQPTYTATGFSTDDIKALGDFPDYATLSGVPLPEAYPKFNIEKALPRPYRPFRWAYHQTMSITKMETDWWLELDGQYAARIEERKALFEEHGKGVLDFLPGSELACKELMEMCIQFVCARYPQYFSLDKESMILHNRLLDTTADLKAMHPLHVLVNHIPEDFAIMLRNPDDGYYYFRAGIICSSLGWNLAGKLGMQLHEIHQPIPDYKEKMQFSMDRYFAKKPTSKPIQRGSWGLEVETPLYMPPGSPHEVHRLSQSPTLELSQCNLRVDWQTLRRLPLSGAVVFNFKALFTTVTEFRDEPYIPALLLKVLKEGKKSLMQYKNTWHVEHVVIPALEDWAREQREKGMVEKDWEEQTLAESPFFPGWKEKWTRQQGF